MNKLSDLTDSECDRLMDTLVEAIQSRAAYERTVGYTSESALLASWRSIYAKHTTTPISRNQ